MNKGVAEGVISMESGKKWGWEDVTSGGNVGKWWKCLKCHCFSKRLARVQGGGCCLHEPQEGI